MKPKGAGAPRHIFVLRNRELSTVLAQELLLGYDDGRSRRVNSSCYGCRGNEYPKLRFRITELSLHDLFFLSTQVGSVKGCSSKHAFPKRVRRTGAVVLRELIKRCHRTREPEIARQVCRTTFGLA